jgi:CIC family chloride channel protein
MVPIHTDRKAIYFLSSVLVISSFAVIVLKTFAHWVFISPTYINGILKLSFINSILPIAGLLLPFCRQKSSWWYYRKGTSQILYSPEKASIIQKKQMCSYYHQFLNCWSQRIGGFRGLLWLLEPFGSNYAQNTN